MRPRKLTEEDEAELLRLIGLRREVTTKKLMARFRVSRTTIWKMEHELHHVPHETKQNVHKQRESFSEAEIGAFLRTR